MSKKTILHFHKENLEVYNIDSSSGAKTEYAETAWGPTTLSDKLKLIKLKFETNSVRVLLDNELVNETVIKYPQDVEVTYELVLADAKKSLPDLDPDNWDYKIEKDQVTGTQKVLVFTPSSPNFGLLLDAAVENNLVIEDVEPIAFAPKDGVEPVVALARKSLKGKDQDILALTPFKTNLASLGAKDSLEEKTQVSVPVGKPVKKTNFVIIGLVALVVLFLAVLIPKLVTTLRPAPTPSPSPSISPSPSPTPTPAPLDLSSLEVQVLNGSGVVGEASSVRALLVKAGFDDDNIETGNADNYDYLLTSISQKPGLSRDVAQSVQTALGARYKYDPSPEDLPLDSEYDLIITFGQKTDN